jgi:hypothetical protein
MKFDNLIIVLIFCFSIGNIPFCRTVKQDALTSLVIFARSQADIQREHQVKLLQKQNSTTIDRIEFANLLKKTQPVNLKQIAEDVKKNSTTPVNNEHNSHLKTISAEQTDSPQKPNLRKDNRIKPVNSKNEVKKDSMSSSLKIQPKTVGVKNIDNKTTTANKNVNTDNKKLIVL